MCEFEDKLIDYTIDANRATDKLKIRVCRVVEDEVVSVERGQTAPSYATSQLFNTVSEVLAYLARYILQSGHDSYMALAP